MSINRRVPFKRRVQVYILVNNHRFRINPGSNLFIFCFQKKEEDVTTDAACFSSLPFSHIVLAFCQYITFMIAMDPVQQKNKKYDLTSRRH